MSKLIVIEASELPFEVIKLYKKLKPKSALAKILDNKNYCLTYADDLEEELLYPTQTWASMNTGKPFSEHKIKWFNDPKDYDDFYWAQAATAGHSTVLISTLHSSPLKEFSKKGNYKAIIPDFFASDNETLPKKYQALQALNTSLTFSNRRATSSKDTLVTAIKHFIKSPSLANWGIGSKSIKDLFYLIPQVIKNPENLRKVQFPLLMQIFLNELNQHKPELAVVTTNHIASSMHRYLHASKAYESANAVYDEEWMGRHNASVVEAMDMLERWLQYIQHFADKEDYAIAVVTSMGQKPNSNINQAYLDEYQYDYRLLEMEKFFDKIGVDLSSCQVVGAMLPQYAFKAQNKEHAKTLENQLLSYLSDDQVNRYGHYTKPNTSSPNKTSIQLSGILYSVDRNQDIVTITIMIKPNANRNVAIGENEYSYDQLGFEKIKIDDHHSGTHSKWGVLMFNDKFAGINKNIEKPINYLKIADIFKNTLGMKKASC